MCQNRSFLVTNRRVQRNGIISAILCCLSVFREKHVSGDRFDDVLVFMMVALRWFSTHRSSASSRATLA
jgi:hypothetical protein